MAKYKTKKMKYTPKEFGDKIVSELISDIKKRHKITTREARDIAKAVGNAATLAKTATKGSGAVKKGSLGKATRNIAKQVGETARAAATGKKGTRAGKVTATRNEYPYGFKEGKKRTKYPQFGGK